MKVQVLDLTRVWAMITGLALVLAYAVFWSLGLKASEMLPMLITAIGGFEMFLFSQEIWVKRKSNHG